MDPYESRLRHKGCTKLILQILFSSNYLEDVTSMERKIISPVNKTINIKPRIGLFKPKMAKMEESHKVDMSECNTGPPLRARACNNCHWYQTYLEDVLSKIL